MTLREVDLDAEALRLAQVSRALLHSPYVLAEIAHTAVTLAPNRSFLTV